MINKLGELGGLEVNAEELSFGELEAAYKLARKTFKQTDYGFVNVAGESVEVQPAEVGYKVRTYPPSMGAYIATHPGPLQSGAEDKTTVLEAIRTMLSELGCRIIE